MNFFRKLSESGITDVIIQFEKDEKGIVSLFVAPKTITKKNLLKSVKPIRFVGKPEEIDMDFFSQLEEHLVDMPKEIEPVKEEPKETVVKEEAPKKSAPELVKEASEKLKAKAKAEPKVDNIAPLKEFYETIKNDDILPFKDQIQEFLGKLSDAEKQKPYPKKVLNDLEIRIRKEEIRIAALKKAGFIKDEPVVETVIEEPKSEIDPGVEEPITEEIAIPSPVAVEEIEVIEEVIENTQPVIPTAIPIPVPPVPTPVPAAPPVIEIKRFRQETVSELKMIVEDFTYEQYNSVGWTDQQLLDNGKAIMETKVIDIEITEEEYMALKAQEIPAPAPQKLGYTFPKPFDAPDEE